MHPYMNLLKHTLLNYNLKSFAASLMLALIFLLAPQGNMQAQNVYDPVAINLPDLLTANDGTPITTLQQWEDIRRPELLEIMSKHYFGYTPDPAYPVRWEVVEEQAGVDIGANTTVTRRQVKIYFSQFESDQCINVLFYIPEDRPRPSPVIIAPNYNGNQTVTGDNAVVRSRAVSWNRSQKKFQRVSNYGVSTSSGGAPITLFANKGYTYATFSYNDTATDFDPNHTYTANRVWWGMTRTSRDSYEWGHIGLWAWAISRTVDYIAADEDLDVTRIATMGHSRLGAAVEWAGAQDRRIKVTVASGAGPLERDPDLKQDITNPGWTFSWHSPDQQNYVNVPNTEWPWDMHMVAALHLPSHFYVSASSSEPYGSSHAMFMTQYYATPVANQIFNMTGMEDYPTAPNTTTYIHNDLAFDIHPGTHSYGYTEWVNWINYFDLKMGVDSRFYAPTNPGVTLINGDGAPAITWVDNASSETGYEIQRRAAGGNSVTITMDNDHPNVEYTGGYHVNSFASSLLDAYGGSQLLHLSPAAGKSDYVRYTPNFNGQAGEFELHLWWGKKNCPRNHPLKVVASGVEHNLTINMELGVGGWVNVGTFTFQQGDYVEFSAGFDPLPSGYSMADAVRFYRENGPSEWTTVGTVGANTEVFVDQSAAAATQYEYRIRALDTNNTKTSAWTPLVSVTTVNGGEGLPEGSELYLSRNLNEVTVGATDTIADTVATHAKSIGYTITNYGADPLTLNLPITISNLSNCTVSVSVAPNASIASLGNTSLVLSVTPTLTGAWSAVISVASNDADENPYTWTIAGTAGVPPIDLDAPSNFAAIANSGTSVSLTWVNQAADGEGYAIERRAVTADNPLEIILDDGDAGVDNTNFTNMTWGSGHYQSDALNAFAQVGSSQRVRYTPEISGQEGSFEISLWYNNSGHCTNVPVTVTQNGVPTVVTVDQTQNQSQWFSIGTFNMVQGDYVEYSADFSPSPAGSTQRVMADGVRFYKAISGGPWTEIARIANPMTESYTDNGVSPETIYQYRIAADSIYGLGNWADSISVTTPAGGSSNTYANWTGSMSWNGMDSAETADPDGDGYTNLLEYALNANPMYPTSNAHTVSLVEDGGTHYIAITFDKNKAADDLIYTIQSSTDLTNWSDVVNWSAGADATNTTDVSILSEDANKQTLRVRAPVTTKTFMRLRVTR